MPYYGDSTPYYYGGSSLSNHGLFSSGTGTSRNYHSPFSSSRYSPHLSTISESPLTALRSRYSPNPTGTSTIGTTSSARPRRIIDTADIDVSKPPRTQNLSQDHHNQPRHRLRRDRPTVKIRSQALKDNPALREYNEKHERSVGELLVEKFLIKDKFYQPYKPEQFRPPIRQPVSNPMAVQEEDEEDEEAIMMAMTHKITRRMTRRRSSADIVLDPERLEREAAYAQVQAELLDNLVAEEQAEIEVEARIGVFVKRPALRLTPEVPDSSDAESDGAETEVENSEEIRKRALATRRKRRRTLSKPKSIHEDESAGSQSDDEDEGDDEGRAKVKKNADQDDKVAKLKVEACNSEDDMSTSWVKTGNPYSATESSPVLIEQFRESIRLPAPKGFENVSTEVVLPVRRRYIKDPSRNSVHLALKPIRRSRGDDENRKSKKSIDDDVDASQNNTNTSITVNDSQSMSAKTDVTDDRVKKGQTAASLKKNKSHSAVVEVDGIASAVCKGSKNEGSELRGEKIVENICVQEKHSEPKSAEVEDICSGKNGDDFVTRRKSGPEFEDISEKGGEETSVENQAKAGSKTKKGSTEKSKVKTKISATKKNENQKKSKISDNNKVDLKKKKKTLKILTGVLDKAAEGFDQNNQEIEQEEQPESLPKNKFEKLKIVSLKKKSLTPVEEEKEILFPKKRNEIKKVDSEAIMRIEKKILDDADFQRKYVEPKGLEQRQIAKLSTVETSEVKKINTAESLPQKLVVTQIDEPKEILKGKLESVEKSEVDFWSEIRENAVLSPEPLKKNLIQNKIIEESVNENIYKEEALVQSTKETVLDSKEVVEELPKSPKKKIVVRKNDLKVEKGEIKENTVEENKIDKRDDSFEDRKISEKEEPKVPETEMKIVNEVEVSDDRTVGDSACEIKASTDSIEQVDNKEVIANEVIDPPVSKLDLTHIPQSIDDSDFVSSEVGTPFFSQPSTPLISEPSTPLASDFSQISISVSVPETSTPLISEPSTPLASDCSQISIPIPVPGTDISISVPVPETDISISVPEADISIPVPDLERPGSSIQPTSQESSSRPSTVELSSTVRKKKIQKWPNQNNLSRLKDQDDHADSTNTSRAGSATQQTSTPPSTTATKKKKIVKRKKSATLGAEKKPEADKTKPSTKKTSTTKKTTVTKKKVASAASSATPSPQASNLLKSPASKGSSARNSPSQRPTDLIKMFYTTPALLLTATPRDLRKVRRAKIKKKNKPTASGNNSSSFNSDSTGSQSAETTSAESNAEEDPGHKRLASSTRSNDSGFDGSPRICNCDMACHKKCEKLMGNLCGLNQKLVAEALQALKKGPAYERQRRKSFVRRRLRPMGSDRSVSRTSTPSPESPSHSLEHQRSSEGADHHHHTGRVTPPATNLPRFKKYEVTDFNFLKMLGKGSFGKVLLAELRDTECVYAVKCLKKDVVLEDDDVECTLIERKVLTLATRHPYLCHLFCTFQTDSHLFFVMEYLNGGDLMFHIQKSGRFSEQRARFYAAEIWSGLIFLHKKGIVYRDLKLDNVLLDYEGHIRIADFGMCKLQIFLDRTADTFCGTPDYMAPEIIKGLKYNQAVDWWSYGVLLYEMLTGQSPFSGCDEDELFWSICNERPFIPRYLNQSSTEILVALLEKDSGKRIPGHEIACHSFFSSIAWDKLERRALEPPFKPAVEHTLDTRYFDTAFTAERPRLTPVPEQMLTSMDQTVFRGFSYTNPNATD